MKRILAVLTAALLTSQAQADTFLLGGLGYSTGPGFRYSLLHKGTGPGAMSGTVLGWLDSDFSWTGSSLDATGVADDGKAFYREGDGALEFKATVYPTEFAGPAIGSVVVTGTGFLPGLLDGVGRTNAVLALLKYEFDLLPSALATWLGGLSETRTLSYVDKDYAAFSTGGVQANRYESGEIVLWGARGFIGEVNASGGTHMTDAEWLTAHPGTGHQMGTDLVIHLGGRVTDCVIQRDCHPTPENSTIGLLAVGLLAMGLVGKKMGKRSWR